MKNKKVVLVMALTLSMLMTGLMGCGAKEAESAAPATEVKTETVKEEALQKLLPFLRIYYLLEPIPFAKIYKGNIKGSCFATAFKNYSAAVAEISVQSGYITPI